MHTVHIRYKANKFIGMSALLYKKYFRKLRLPLTIKTIIITIMNESNYLHIYA